MKPNAPDRLTKPKNVQVAEVLDAFRRDILFNLGQSAPEGVYAAVALRIDALNADVMALVDGVV